MTTIPARQAGMALAHADYLRQRQAALAQAQQATDALRALCAHPWVAGATYVHPHGQRATQALQRVRELLDQLVHEGDAKWARLGFTAPDPTNAGWELLGEGGNAAYRMAHEVGCPVCGAPAGYRCRDFYGKNAHGERVRNARLARAAEREGRA